MAKEQIGAKIPRPLYERLKNAIFWIGRGHTIQKCVEEAITTKVEELEQKFNEGKPFEPRSAELPHSNKKIDPEDTSSEGDSNKVVWGE